MKSHRCYHNKPVIQLDEDMCKQPGEKTKNKGDEGQDDEYDGNSIHLRVSVGIGIETWIYWSCELHTCFLVWLPQSWSRRKKERSVT